MPCSGSYGQNTDKSSKSCSPIFQEALSPEGKTAPQKPKLLNCCFMFASSLHTTPWMYMCFTYEVKCVRQEWIFRPKWVGRWLMLTETLFRSQYLHCAFAGLKRHTGSRLVSLTFFPGTVTVPMSMRLNKNNSGRSVCVMLWCVSETMQLLLLHAFSQQYYFWQVKKYVMEVWSLGMVFWPDDIVTCQVRLMTCSSKTTGLVPWFPI